MKNKLENELKSLILIRDRSTGLDLKRIRYKIVELQNQIDHLSKGDV